MSDTAPTPDVPSPQATTFGPSALATAEARGDIDGNGKNSTFRVSVSPDTTGTAKVDPNVVKVDPEE